MVKLNRRKSGRNDKYRKRVSDEALAAALEATGGFQGMAARMLSLTPAAVCIRIQKSQKLQATYLNSLHPLRRSNPQNPKPITQNFLTCSNQRNSCFH